MSDEMTEFSIETPEADLEHLRLLIRHARWPERETVDDWSQAFHSRISRTSAATGPMHTTGGPPKRV